MLYFRLNSLPGLAGVIEGIDPVFLVKTFSQKFLSVTHSIKPFSCQVVRGCSVAHL